MSTQLHKNFTDDQVKSFLKSYLDKEIKISYILQMLKIKRRRFFKLLAKYRKDPDSFSIQNVTGDGSLTHFNPKCHTSINIQISTFSPIDQLDFFFIFTIKTSLRCLFSLFGIPSIFNR